MKLIFYLLDCFINIYTYPNPKPTPYNNEKCNYCCTMWKKLRCIDVRMPSSTIRIPSSLNLCWRVRHLGTVNLTSFTIIINEYSKIYKRITYCFRRRQSTHSKVRRPFQKWWMAYVLLPIETVANEESTYIYMWLQPQPFLKNYIIWWKNNVLLISLHYICFVLFCETPLCVVPNNAP